MSTIPLDGCPTASALLAYVEGHADSELRECIEAHVLECQTCRAALETLRETLAPMPTTGDVDRGTSAHTVVLEDRSVPSSEPASEDRGG